MYEKGCYVVNANNVICEISDIVMMNMDEVWRLIKEIKAIDEALIENEKQLYSELAFVLGVEKSELNEIIEQNIGE